MQKFVQVQNENNQIETKSRDHETTLQILQLYDSSHFIIVVSQLLKIYQAHIKSTQCSYILDIRKLQYYINLPETYFEYHLHQTHVVALILKIMTCNYARVTHTEQHENTMSFAHQNFPPDILIFILWLRRRF